AFTLHGWIRTRDTVSANITIRCFSSRSSGYPVSTESITADISGNTDWQSFYKEFSLPSNAWYFDIRLSFTGSGSSRSKAFFDNVGLIQWEEWMPHDQNLIVHPNDFYWFQLRSSEGVKSITCQITETSLTPTRDTQRKAGKPPALPVVIYPTQSLQRADQHQFRNLH
ncbi:MAG TPA: hypothetical protein DHW79_11520, partial [Candidatus Cloacimonas sp.]|nr:hypothetical protein [Candidatus Cloacimonas sp.]